MLQVAFYFINYFNFNLVCLATLKSIYLEDKKEDGRIGTIEHYKCDKCHTYSVVHIFSGTFSSSWGKIICQFNKSQYSILEWHAIPVDTS